MQQRSHPASGGAGVPGRGRDARPLVSVLLASRDGERYLGEALASLTAQTWPEVEVMAVDDGSRDGTGRLLERFAAAHPRARVLRTAGVGLAGALDVAAREAAGELLARQDDDDVSHPERLARQVAFLAAHPAIAVVGAAAEMIGPDGGPLGAYPIPLEGAAIARTLRRGPPFVHGSVMMRASAYRAAGGYRAGFRAAQDYDLWLRFPSPTSFANLEEPLYRWRRHPGGVFARARDEQLRFGALARAFAAERAERGADSYPELVAAGGDWEKFLARYAGRARLLRLMGETWLREGRVGEARRLLARALASGAGAPALAWWLASFGVALTPRAARARRAARAGAGHGASQTGDAGTAREGPARGSAA